MFVFQRCSVLLIICTYLCLINGFITAVHPVRNNVAHGRPLTTMAMSEASKLTIPKNYNVAIGSIATSAALIFGAHNIIAGIPFVLLSLLLFIQAGKVRFVFDDEALEIFVARKNDQGEVENASRENYVVGGKNRNIREIRTKNVGQNNHSVKLFRSLFFIESVPVARTDVGTTVYQCNITVSWNRGIAVSPTLDHAVIGHNSS